MTSYQNLSRIRNLFYSDIDLLFLLEKESEKKLKFLEAGLTAQSQWALIMEKILY